VSTDSLTAPSLTSTGTFKVSYTQKHTQLFLDQVYTSTISGFLPDTNLPDPNWGRCLQCAAIDRARFKLNPIPSRSQLCAQCFLQYCYDPQNPPSRAELPGRRFQFVDPDPVGFSLLEDFFTWNKFKLVGGLIGLIAFISALIFGLCVSLASSRNNLDRFTLFLRFRLIGSGGGNVSTNGCNTRISVRTTRSTRSSRHGIGKALLTPIYGSLQAEHSPSKHFFRYSVSLDIRPPTLDRYVASYTYGF
jgi:Lysophospholipase catalytic domain